MNRETFVSILNQPLLEPTGCWRDYNSQYLRWTRLKQLQLIPRGLIVPGEVVDPPKVSDYTSLDC